MTVDIRKLFQKEEALNEKMYTTLLESLVSHQQQGFDYLKFKVAVQSLRDMGMDTETSIKSAFATAATIGFTKDSLAKSLQEYKVVLEQERKKFAQAMKNQIANNVDAKRLEYESLQSKLEENQRMIEKLISENEIIKSNLTNWQAEIDQAQSRIENTRDDFKKTYDYIQSLIETDEDLYQTFL